MTLTEQFIQDHTHQTYQCSNGLKDGYYHEWLSPHDALHACEITQQELLDKACKWLCEHLYTVVDKEHPSRHHVESIPPCGEYITQTEFVVKFKNAMQK